MSHAAPKAKQVHHGERGFIVVAVLWLLAALSALVLIYSTYVINTALVVRTSADHVEANALVTATLELAAYRLTLSKEDVRPTHGSFKSRIGTARVTVDFRSEGARIDLNTAPKALLTAFMIGVGAAPINAEDYADRIIGWRSKAKSRDSDPEDALYRMAGITYNPRHAPFPQADELWLVRGIPPQIVERMLPFATVFSGSNSANVLEAAPQVLAALPNMTPERLQTLLSLRDDPQTDPRTLLASMGGDPASPSSNKTFRVNTVIDFDNGRRTAAEVVILLFEDGVEPYRVLSWRNTSDGSVGVQRAGL